MKKTMCAGLLLLWAATATFGAAGSVPRKEPVPPSALLRESRNRAGDPLVVLVEDVGVTVPMPTKPAPKPTPSPTPPPAPSNPPEQKAAAAVTAATTAATTAETKVEAASEGSDPDSITETEELAKELLQIRIKTQTSRINLETNVGTARTRADFAALKGSTSGLTFQGTTTGDPVRLATGSFYLGETDLEYSFDGLPVRMSRTYESGRSAAHSLGAGWTFSYDTRVVRGIDRDADALALEAEKAYDDADKAYRSLVEQQGGLEGRISSSTAAITGGVASASAALDAAKAAVAAARAADGYGLQDALDLQAWAQAVYDWYKGPAGALASVASASGVLGNMDASLVALGDDVTYLGVQAAILRHRADQAKANKDLDAMTVNDRDPEHLVYIRNERVVLHDEGGATKNFWTEALPDYESTSILPDGSVNYYPQGSALTADQPTGESLALRPDGGFTRILKDGTRYEYSYLGQLETIVDRSRNTLRFAYSGGHLSSLSDDYGRVTNLSWEGERLTGIVDPESRTLVYGYDPQGHLASVRDAGGDEVKYRYDGDLLVELEKPDHSLRKYRYEARSGEQVVYETEDEEKAVEKFRYFEGYTEYENPSGIVEKHYFDKRYRETKIEYADGSYRDFEYNDGPISMIDENGHFSGWDELTDEYGHFDGKIYHTHYGYDSRRNLSSVVYPDSTITESWTYTNLDKVETHIEKNGQTTTYHYDEKGKLLSIDYPESIGESFTYDERGRLFTHTDRNETTRTFAYDLNGYVSSVATPQTDAEGLKRTVNEVYANDAIGRIRRYTDGTGVWTEYEYNGDGKVTKVTDMRGNFESFEYNNRKDLVAYTDKLKNVTNYVYDHRHLLLRAVNPLGEVVAYKYRDDGKVKEKNLGRLVAPLSRSKTEALAGGSGAATTLAEAARESLGVIDGAGRSQRLATLGSTTGPKEKPAVPDLVLEGSPLVVWESHNSYDYDSRGNPTSRLQLETGVSSSVKYWENGLPRLSIDGEGKATSYQFDPMGRLEEKKDAYEQKTLYSYTHSGRLETLTDRNNHTTTFRYDKADRLEERIDPRTKSDFYRFDGKGNLVWHRDRNQAESEIRYDEFDRPIVVTLPHFLTDPAQPAERFHYDPAGRLVKKTDPKGNSTSYFYDSYGRLFTETDALERVTTYGYDEAGRVTSREDRRHNTWTYGYDALGRLKSVQDPYLKATSYRYSVYGSLASATNALDETWRNDYDEAGRRIAAVDPLGAATVFTYDGNGRVLTETDAVGRVTSSSYDDLGRLASEAHGAETPTLYGYDYERNLTSITDASKVAYTFHYNELDLPDFETNRLGVTQSYLYDDGGQLKYKTDFKATVFDYGYDAAGRLKTLKAQGSLLKSFDYDAAGNLTRAANPARSYVYDYDPLGRLRTAQDLDLGEELSYLYDEEGNLTGLAWHDGKRRTTKTYGLAGELLSVVDSEDGTTSFGYDEVLRETRRQLPNGLVQEKGYDPAGRLTVTRTNGGPFEEANKFSNEAYVYDPSGKRSYTVDEKGRITAYKYDAAGRLSETLYPFKSGKVATDFAERLSLGYFPSHEAGILTQTGNPKLDLADLAPRLPGLDSELFANDLAAELEKQGDLAKNYLAIASVAEGKWKVVPGEGATTFATRLEPTSLEVAMIRAAAIRANGRNTSIDVNPELWDETYGYDERDNRTTKANGWGRIDYSYDEESRLKTAGGRSYLYDPNGNLEEESLGNIRAEYEYDPENRVLDIYSQSAGFVGKGAGSAWTLQAGVRYEYDALGRRVSRTEYDTILQGQKRQRGWKAETATNYLYEGLSMRVLAEALDEHFNPDELLVPYQPWAGDTVRKGHGPSKPWPASRSNYYSWRGDYHAMDEFVYGNGEILERIDFDTAGYRSAVRGDAQYYALDVLGSVMMTTGLDGKLRERYAYDAYGQAFEGSFRRINDLGYNGKRTDPTTGLVDYGFRDYAPRLGRFTTVDPIQAGMNWYAYVGGDPVNYVDVWGLRASDAQKAELPSISFVVPSAIASPAVLDFAFGAAFPVIAGLATVAIAMTPEDTMLFGPPSPSVGGLSFPADEQTPPVYIYRTGKGNGTNLTPRPVDVGGLSYSLTRPSAPYTMTTLKQVNSSGVLKAIIDGFDHVSVFPSMTDTMKVWIESRANANTNPHAYTLLLQSISTRAK